MKPESKRYSTTVGSRTITFETGKLAHQAGGAVTVGIDEAIIFAAATMGGVREGIDFSRSPSNTKSACMPAAKSPARSSAARDAPAPKRFSPPASPTVRCAHSLRTECAMKSR